MIPQKLFPIVDSNERRHKNTIYHYITSKLFNTLKISSYDLSTRKLYKVNCFVGNECKKLLKSTDVLEAIITKHTRITRKRNRSFVMRMAFLNAFRTFEDVVHTSFGTELLPGWEKALENFRCAYMALDISITTKVHLVFVHVEPYCKNLGHGLGVLSEHAFESVHRDFLVHWERHKVKDSEHPEFDTRLKKTMCEYNSGHL